MRSSSLLGLVAMTVGAVSAFPYHQGWNFTSKTAYFQDVDPAGSSIIALHISDTNGTLSNPVRTATGGKGLDGLLGPSQDPVTVSGNYIFSVNQGDDTLSMFLIDPRNPEHPSLVGKPAPTLGETPVSVAYSSRLNTACVLNAGGVAGVTCFSVDENKGLTALGGLRPIPQTENADPTPAPAPPLVIGMDIIFNPSSTALFVSIRSNGGQPGLLYAYPVIDNQLSTHYVVSSFPTLPLIFSLNFLDRSDTHLLVTVPHLGNGGASFLEVAYPSLHATLTKTINIPGPQNATCWAAYAPKYDTVYILDALKTDITVLNPETGDVKGQVQFTEQNGVGFNAGAKDSKVDGDYLYVLGNGATARIYVFKIGGPRLLEQVQVIDLSETLGSIPFWLGMAVWPAHNY